MKSQYSRILALLVAIGIFASACAPKTSEPTNAPVTEATKAPVAAEKAVLTVAHYYPGGDPSEAPMEAIFDEFRQANPDIDLVVQQNPLDQYSTILDTAFLAGKEPDLAFFMGFHVPDRLKGGMIVPIEDYIYEWLPDIDWYEEAIQNQTRIGNGVLACFPFQGNTWPMFYNMKVLNDSGVAEIPTTTAELIDAAQKVRAAGYKPWVVGGNDWTGSHVIAFMLESRIGYEKAVDMFANGGFAADADARSAIETFVQLRDAGVFVDNVEGLVAMDMEQAFFSDTAAMMSSGSWVMTNIPDSVAEHVTLGGLPIMPGSPYDRPTTWLDTGGLAFCLTRNGANNLDAAKRFVQFFYTEAHMASLVEAASITVPFPVTLDESKLGPVFKQSLTLSEKYQTFLFTDPMIPASVARGFDMAAAQAFQPGTSVDTILQALDAAYQNK